MGMECYTVLDCIGEGSFGRVFRGRRRATGRIVAMKFIPKVGKSDKALKSLKREIEIMRSMHHRNIIEMLDSFETEREVVAITDYAEGDLHQIIEDDGRLSESVVRSVACQLVSALYYLHANRILHRDMKPENILIGQDGVVKLCDFGFARLMGLNTMVLTSIKGTPLYMAPELVEEKPYDHTADLWALGCILYELFVGKPPFYTNSIFQLAKMITKNNIEWPQDMSPAFKDFLSRLLQKNVRKRLQWPELLDHPFVHHAIEIPDCVRLLSSPFTQPLTPMQLAEKERQTKQMLRPNGSRLLKKLVALKQVKEEDKTDDSQDKLKQLPQRSKTLDSKDRKLDGADDPYNKDALQLLPNEAKFPGTGGKLSKSPEVRHDWINGTTRDVAPPTPRENRISIDYEREQGIRDQVQENKRQSVSHARSAVDRQGKYHNNVDDYDTPTNNNKRHCPSSLKNHEITLSYPNQQGQEYSGWWLRASVEAWERLADATEVDFTQRSSSDNALNRQLAENSRQHKRRTALSLLSDTDFAHRLSLRLASASVIEDKADWKSIQPWSAALLERRSITRPVSAGTSKLQQGSGDSIPGLEAAGYLRNLLRLITNLVTIKCDVSIIVRFCDILELPVQLIKLLQSMIASTKLQQRPWFEQILLDIIIVMSAYFVSEIGQRQTISDSVIQGYTEHALHFIDLVPELVNQECDKELQIRDQTLLCIRFLMERMVERADSIIQKFYKDISTHHLATLKTLIMMPSVSKHPSAEADSSRLDDVREHAMAALTAFTYASPSSIVFIDQSGPTKRPDSKCQSVGFCQTSTRTHDVAVYVANQLCQPELETHFRLYLSYFFLPRLCLQTAKLFYDCIQAHPSFAVYCVRKFPIHLDDLFELYQKKPRGLMSDCEHGALRELITHSLTSLIIQLGYAPDRVLQECKNLCKKFVESQMPGHASALALLLSYVSNVHDVKLPIEAHDLAQAMSLVLVSPLAQGQAARARLLSIQTESFVRTGNNKSFGSSKESLTSSQKEWELLADFGFPQFSWPANHGWLDGLFSLAYHMCAKVDTPNWQSFVESRVLERLWLLLAEVFNLNEKPDPQLGSLPPDWTMLSPLGVLSALHLAITIFSKKTQLCSEAVLDKGTHMLSVLQHFFTDHCINEFRQSPWSAVYPNDLALEILSSSAHLLNLALVTANYDRQMRMLKAYMEQNLLYDIVRVLVKFGWFELSEDNKLKNDSVTDQRRPSLNLNAKSVLCNFQINAILLAHIRTILGFVFRLCNGPKHSPSIEDGCANSDASNTNDLIRMELISMMKSQLSQLIIGNSSDKDVSRMIHCLIGWCMQSSIPELQLGSCVMLSQALQLQVCDTPSDRNSRGQAAEFSISAASDTVQYVWSIINSTDSKNNEHSTRLVSLLKDSKPRLTIHALYLLNNLVLYSSCGSHTMSSCMKSVEDFENQSVCRSQACYQTKPNRRRSSNNSACSFIRLNSYCQFLNEPLQLCTDLLDHTDPTVRQAALLVLGNAAFASAKSYEIICPAIDQIRSLLESDTSSKVRANAASTLGNLNIHSTELYDSIMANKILNCLLETGCFDGDRRVQEAALAALRSLCASDSRMCQDLIILDGPQKLGEIQSTLRNLSASRSGRRPTFRTSSSNDSNSALVDYEVIIAHADALCQALQ